MGSASPQGEEEDQPTIHTYYVYGRRPRRRPRPRRPTPQRTRPLSSLDTGRWSAWSFGGSWGCPESRSSLLNRMSRRRSSGSGLTRTMFPSSGQTSPATTSGSPAGASPPFTYVWAWGRNTLLGTSTTVRWTAGLGTLGWWPRGRNWRGRWIYFRVPVTIGHSFSTSTPHLLPQPPTGILRYMHYGGWHGTREALGRQPQGHGLLRRAINSTCNNMGMFMIVHRPVFSPMENPRVPRANGWSGRGSWRDTAPASDRTTPSGMTRSPFRPSTWWTTGFWSSQTWDRGPSKATAWRSKQWPCCWDPTRRTLRRTSKKELGRGASSSGACSMTPSCSPPSGTYKARFLFWFLFSCFLFISCYFKLLLFMIVEMYVIINFNTQYYSFYWFREGHTMPHPGGSLIIFYMHSRFQWIQYLNISKVLSSLISLTTLIIIV